MLIKIKYPPSQAYQRKEGKKGIINLLPAVARQIPNSLFTAQLLLLHLTTSREQEKTQQLVCKWSINPYFGMYLKICFLNTFYEYICMTTLPSAVVSPLHLKQHHESLIFSFQLSHLFDLLSSVTLFAVVPKLLHSFVLLTVLIILRLIRF